MTAGCGRGAGASRPSAIQLRRAAHALRRGAVVAYATEGVFGIGCDPRNRRALARVIAIKGRSRAKGLILIAASENQLLRFASVPDGERGARIRASWPGPVTWVLDARAGASDLVTGGRDTVAVRVTAHPGAAALCRAFGGALVSTSANLSGRRPARTALAARRALGRHVDYILPGAVGGQAGPSRILDGRDGRTLRGPGR